MTNPIVAERFAIYDSGQPTERRIRRHCYWCPGCDSLHCIAINPDKQPNGAGWTFTGTMECPTYSPSQKSTFGKDSTSVCHTFIRNGQIEFLNDCTHALRGQTVPLPPLPDWVVGETDDD